MHASPTNDHSGAAVPRIACLAALGALLALGMVFVLHGELNADEGFYLVASRFVTDGLRPFRDFGFTQTPLVPYANVPWLEAFGYSLTGIRLAGLGWTVGAVVTGVILLRRRHGWLASTVFVLLLLSSPGWLAWATKGKTYAFSSFTVLLGAIALTMDGTAARRWTLFIAAAALAAAGRLTTVAFFLPAGLALLIFTPGWPARAMAVTTTLVIGALTLLLVTAGTWDSFYFWTAGFHAASTIHQSLSHRLFELAGLAPAVWLVLAIASSAAVRSRQKPAGFLIMALIVGVAANVLPVSGYAEYATAFVPALAWVIAPAPALLAPQWRIALAGTTAVATGAAVWLTPPSLRANTLRHASEACSFLAAHTTPGDTVVASMPEIAVAARCAIPPALAMGKFALTESLTQTEADQRLMVTPTTLIALLEHPATRAVVFSAAKKWNFSWSAPDYHFLAGKSRTMIFTAIQRDYELVYTNPEYVIFLRKHRDE